MNAERTNNRNSKEEDEATGLYEDRREVLVLLQKLSQSIVAE